MEACCCSTSSSVLAGAARGGAARRLAAAAPAAARWGAAGFGTRVVVLAHPIPRPTAARRARRGVIRAVFERFTERAVKAVVLSQREAGGLGEHAVAPRHLFLGLVAEDRSSGGYLSSGINIERAREECRGIASRDADAPFSATSKQVFEVAVVRAREHGRQHKQSRERTDWLTQRQRVRCRGTPHKQMW